MQTQQFVQISVTCHSAEEMQRAIDAINYHLETLNPRIKRTSKTLTVRVPPLDPTLFEPDEACDIIRQTLAQSLTFTNEWTCTLHTIN